MDLSSPEGYSVNDVISKEDSSFHYASVDWAMAHIAQLGPGTLLGHTVSLQECSRITS